jgi:hypothetical protein
LNALAAEQQTQRYEDGVWDDSMLTWLEDPRQKGDGHLYSTKTMTSITEILIHGIGKRLENCEQKDRNQVQRCLRKHGWTRKQSSGAIFPRGAWTYVKDSGD